MARESKYRNLNNRINFRDYQKVFNDHILAGSEEIGVPLLIFQQDNVPVHFANCTFDWLLSNSIYVID